jgi:hypothetical protein
MRLLRVDETSVGKMLNTHMGVGYIVISASRGNLSRLDNHRRTNALKAHIKKSGYSYIPVWGGYIENAGTDDAMEVKEASFVVFPFRRTRGADGDLQGLDDKDGAESLKHFGARMCRLFDQEAFLYVYGNVDRKRRFQKLGRPPVGIGMKAQFITGTGKVTGTFNLAGSYNSAVDMYYTNLRRNSSRRPSTSANSFALRSNERTRKRAYWIACPPRTLKEAYSRLGEVFVMVTEQVVDTRLVDVVVAMRAAGFAADEIATALTAVEYSPRYIAAALRKGGGLGIGSKEIALALLNIGQNSNYTAITMKEVGFIANDIAAALKAARRDAREVVTALTGAKYGRDDILKALEYAKFTASEIATAERGLPRRYNP